MLHSQDSDAHAQPQVQHTQDDEESLQRREALGRRSARELVDSGSVDSGSLRASGRRSSLRREALGRREALRAANRTEEVEDELDDDDVLYNYSSMDAQFRSSNMPVL